MAPAPAAAEGAEAAALQRPGRLTARAAAAAAGERAGPRAAGRGSKWQPLPAASIRGGTAPGHCGKLRASTPPPRPIRGRLPPPPSASPRPPPAPRPPHPGLFLNRGARPELNLNSALRRRGAAGGEDAGRGPGAAGRWARTQASGEESPGGKLRGRRAAPWLAREGAGGRPREAPCPGGQPWGGGAHLGARECPCPVPVAAAALSPSPLSAPAELEPGRRRPARATRERWGSAFRATRGRSRAQGKVGWGRGGRGKFKI